MSIRYFFALWPDEPTRDRLVEVSSGLPPGIGKIVSRKNLHITLSYLGNQESDKMDKLRTAASSIRGRPFTVRLDSQGWWRRPQVFWLGAMSTPQPLLVLVREINAVLDAFGIRPDARPYHPHLTIARKVARKPRIADIAPIDWGISSFCLVQSRTLPAGSEYEVIETWPLSSD